MLSNALATIELQFSCYENHYKLKENSQKFISSSNQPLVVRKRTTLNEKICHFHSNGHPVCPIPILQAPSHLLQFSFSTEIFI